MKKISALTSLRGRRFLRDLFLKLKYEKQLSTISTLSILWKLCVFEKEASKYTDEEVTIGHPLGFWSGSSLWMEEIVNRYYFSAISSFVYLGAAALLVLIGARRFGNAVGDGVVIVGVFFEAVMLLFLFFVMLFSPKNIDDETIGETDSEDDAFTEIKEEIGEIGRDFASASIRLEKLNENLEQLIAAQTESLRQTRTIAETTAAAVAPNPELIEQMKAASSAMAEFRETVKELNESARSIRGAEARRIIREELENLLVSRLEDKGKNQ